MRRLPAIFLVVFVLGAVGLTGCSIKHVKVPRVSLCRGESCSAARSREQVLTRFYNLLRSNKKSKIRLYRSKPGKRSRGRRGLRFWVASSIPPFPGKLSSINLQDVRYLDREKSEIKIIANASSSVLFIPPACTKGSGKIKVLSPSDVRVEIKSFCSWLVIPFVVKLDMRVDSLDFEAKAFTGHYGLKFGGLTFGGWRGYFRAELDPAPVPSPEKTPPPPAPEPPPKPAVPKPVPVAAAPPSPPAAPAVPPRPKAPPVPAKRRPVEPARPVEAVEETLSRLPELSMATRFEDANGDLILEGGESFSLTVTVGNESGAVVPEAEVALSGTPQLTGALGRARTVRGLKPGASREVRFEGRLAKDVPAEAGSLRIELLAGKRKGLAAAKILKMAMRPAPVEAAEEVLSEISVDDIPPKNRKLRRPNDAAIVVGIGRYREKFIPPVRYAARDAETAARYFENLLGVPAGNIKLLTGDMATKSDLEAYLEDWLVRRVKKDSIVYFYYAGHGSPDPKGEAAYLVPYEGNPDFPAKLYPLSRLYSSLEKLDAKRTVVLLDSCFSGARGRGIVSKGSRPLVLTTSEPDDAGKVVVLSASSGREISSDYDKAEHGLFTYYLLRGLRGGADKDKDRSISVGELFEYVRANVSRTASLELNRDQTPALLPAKGSFRRKRWPIVEKY